MKSSLYLPILATVAFFVVGCATTQSTPTHPKSNAKVFSDKVDVTQTGRASFYGGRWIGRLTANGERYRTGDFTAAHRKLPFNTFVRVTNLKNNRSVVVRINNRGPYVKGRVIDMSVEGAKAIGMVQSGVVPVKIEVLKPQAPREQIDQFVKTQSPLKHG